MRRALQRFEFDAAWAYRDGGFGAQAAGIAGPDSALQNGKPVFTIEQIIHQLTRSGTAWNGLGSNPVPNAGLGTITYAFFDSAVQVYSSERNEFQPLSAAQRDAVRIAFAIWGELINVHFVEGSVATADINLGNLDTDEDYFGAYANFPSWSREGGDIWINANAPSAQDVGLASAGFRTLMHEIGHALGLSHPGDYNAAPGVDITYENDAEYFQDSYQYTIMSYFASSSTGAVRTSFAATPMAHDIAAIQSVYGANMTTRTGDTIYGFHSNAGPPAFDFTLNTQPVIAIWDAGGVDTLDFSGWSSNSRIDLAEGASSDGGGQTFNVQIAYGARIENAIGGGGDDMLNGNQSGNLLRGGAGNDILTGGSGNDREEGGAGADTFVFTATGHSTGYTMRSDGKKLLPDVLLDFTSGTDRIDLSAIDANAGTAENDPFAFIGAGAFTHQAGQLRYEQLNGQVHILGDTDGNGIADLHIIASGTQILAADFIL
ncbi:MAG TPA: M10 family metallopeptidase C-terminal domain-containing protein [Allosphingosinicella sp.]|nr:M10 family metallopeptidase C-terminal domain-containing protein [Allosphingosinicella sp.]